MKRLLMTCDAVGGVWTYSLELCRGLQAYGIEVLLACMGPTPTEAQIDEIATLSNVSMATSDYALEWMPAPWEEVDAAGEWLMELSAAFAPDIVHLNGYAHATLPWPCPVIVVAHSCVRTWWQAVKHTPPPAEEYEIYGQRVRDGLYAADLVITPTEAFRSALEAAYQLDLPGHTIYNARRSRDFFACKKNPFIFSAGRVWDAAKNLQLLADVADRLSWPVLIAGPGTKTEPKSIRWLGQLPPDELAMHLRRAAIYAAPARYEPFGLSILEAALCGCALVLADLPTLRELWGSNAIFVPPEDAAGWASALERLSTDADLRLELAHRAFTHARSFQVKAFGAAYFASYQTLLANRPAYHASEDLR